MPCVSCVLILSWLVVLWPAALLSLPDGPPETAQLCHLDPYWWCSWESHTGLSQHTEATELVFSRRHACLLQVDSEHKGKAIKLWSFMPPHMLSFHLNWVGVSQRFVLMLPSQLLLSTSQPTDCNPLCLLFSSS